MTDREYLISKGWNTLWSEDYWVHPRQYKVPGFNPDWGGYYTPDAVKYQKKLDAQEQFNIDNGIKL